MKVNQFIEHLKMFGQDTEVFIQTTPDDLAQPVNIKLIRLMPASIDERSGCLNQAKVLLTAYIPHKEQTP